MGRINIVAIAVSIVFATISSLAAAQQSQAAKEKMIEALTASAKGECAENIMSPLLLDACESQISANRKMLSPLGKIKEAKFLGMQEMGNSLTAEAYRVEFEQGSMLWMASLDGAGKLLVLWSNGQVKKK